MQSVIHTQGLRQIYLVINLDCEEVRETATLFSKNPRLRICWQKFAILILKNIRTCLAKQDQAGSYMRVNVKL